MTVRTPQGMKQFAAKTRRQPGGVAEEHTTSVRTRRGDPQSGAGTSQNGSAPISTPSSDCVEVQEVISFSEEGNRYKKEEHFKWSHLYRP